MAIATGYFVEQAVFLTANTLLLLGYCWSWRAELRQARKIAAGHGAAGQNSRAPNSQFGQQQTVTQTHTPPARSQSNAARKPLNVVMVIRRLGVFTEFLAVLLWLDPNAILGIWPSTLLSPSKFSLFIPDFCRRRGGVALQLGDLVHLLRRTCRRLAIAHCDVAREARNVLSQSTKHVLDCAQILNERPSQRTFVTFVVLGSGTCLASTVCSIAMVRSHFPAHLLISHCVTEGRFILALSRRARSRPAHGSSGSRSSNAFGCASLALGNFLLISLPFS